MAEIEFTLTPIQSQLLAMRQRRRFMVRCSEARMREQTDAALYEEDFEKIVNKYGLCDICDFSGLNMSAIKVLVNCVVSVMYRFPRLRSKTCFLGSRKGFFAALERFIEYDRDTIRALGVQHICDRALARSLGTMLRDSLPEDGAGGLNMLALSVEGAGIFGGIFVDERDFGTQQFFQIKEALRQNVEMRHFPEGCASVSAVIYHEIGHLLDFLCSVRQDPQLSARYRRSSAEEIKQSLSEYGSTELGEYIAEGFSEYMSNPTPRETARYIYSVIERCYRAL